MTNPKPKSEFIKKLLIMMFSNIIVGFAIYCYIPNKIVNGGVTGIANILYHTCHLNVSISLIVINLIFALISVRRLGIKFLIPSFLNSAMIGLVTDFFIAFFPPFTNNPLLAALFGGVLYGLGMALCFTQGISTGGTDILGRYLQALAPNIPIGKVILGVDAFIIVAALMTYKEVDLALYGILALFVSTYTVDWFIARLNISKLAFVITDKGEDVAKALTSSSPRGVTIIDAKGGYTMQSKQVLVCALKANEMTAFQDVILGVDEASFIIFSESQQIIGNGFRRYF